MILWFTYVKGAWRALTGNFGAGITFKTTLKGAGKLLDSVLTDLWMPTLCFILSAVSLGVGIHKLVSHLVPLATTQTENKHVVSKLVQAAFWTSFSSFTARQAFDIIHPLQ